MPPSLHVSSVSAVPSPVQLKGTFLLQGLIRIFPGGPMVESHLANQPLALSCPRTPCHIPLHTQLSPLFQDSTSLSSCSASLHVCASPAEKPLLTGPSARGHLDPVYPPFPQVDSGFGAKFRVRPVLAFLTFDSHP